MPEPARASQPVTPPPASEAAPLELFIGFRSRKHFASRYRSSELQDESGGRAGPCSRSWIRGRVCQFRVANLCISRLPFDERFEVIFLGIPQQRHALLFTGNSSDPDDGSAPPSLHPLAFCSSEFSPEPAAPELWTVILAGDFATFGLVHPTISTGLRSNQDRVQSSYRFQDVAGPQKPTMFPKVMFT